jgi:aminoglycoside phosphotransferase (APT) family kinase protein
MEKDFQEKIISKVEEYLKTKIVDTKIPPQGMDSKVFFVTDDDGKEYAIKCYARESSGDMLALKLLEENKIDIPVPKVLGVFTFENEQVAILEKINFPLLDSLPVDQMSRCIPSMVNNLKKIHEVKSDKTGFLTEINKGSSWKEVMLSKFTDASPDLDWKEIVTREGLDSKLLLDSVENIIKKIERTDFIDKDYSLLHTDFNQRNLFVNPDSDEIAAIIDWGETMFGDPIYDFARVRMYIWHFNLSDETLKKYYELLSFTLEQEQLEELYWLSRVIEYLAYYSEELNEFNRGRIKMHQDFLRAYKWEK